MSPADRLASAPHGDVLVPQRVGAPIVLRQTPGSFGPGSTDHDLLAVYVGRGETLREGALPVAGRYERSEHGLRFVPAFRFIRGQDYAVRTRRKDGSPRWTNFRIADARDALAAVVTEVYPSGDALPENTLRFYVHFSVPMAPHLAPRFVRLRDAAGNADDAAFMRFKQELWNEDRTRLTLLMDPSRIKRGVASGLQAEPALVEGRRYALSVDAGWPSADGSSVLPAFAKRFVATAALRERPEVTRWSWTSPRPGTRDALTVTFDRPFDRHLLRHALHVATNDGRAVAGTSSVGERETSWSFVPDASWVTSQVRITVAKALEDVAGNSFLELLDRDLSPAGSS